MLFSAAYGLRVLGMTNSIAVQPTEDSLGPTWKTSASGNVMWMLHSNHSKKFAYPRQCWGTGRSLIIQIESRCGPSPMARLSFGSRYLPSPSGHSRRTWSARCARTRHSPARSASDVLRSHALLSCTSAGKSCSYLRASGRLMLAEVWCLLHPWGD